MYLESGHVYMRVYMYLEAFYMYLESGHLILSDVEGWQKDFFQEKNLITKCFTE